MSTKLKDDVLARINALGVEVKTKTEEEARPKLLKILAEQEVNGCDDDPINELIEFCEVFADEINAAKPAPAPAATKTATKKTAKVVEVEEEEPEEEEEESEEEEGEEEEAEEEEEEIVETKKSSKTAAKTAAPVAKAATKVATKTVAKVATTKTTGGREALPGETWDGRNIKKHMDYLKPFRVYFPEKDFELTILKHGFTVRVLGKNAKTTVMNYDELKIVEGKLAGNLYANRFKSVEDLLEVLPEEYHEKEMGIFRCESHPSVRKVSQDELFDIFDNSELIRTSLDRANAKDVKMGVNREKLEETLKEGNKAKPVTKVSAPAAKVVAKKK